MNNRNIILLRVLGFVFMIIPLVFLLLTGEKVVIGEQLCVDGDGNVNLEGLICEETKHLLCGTSEDETEIIQLICFLIIAIGSLMSMALISVKSDEYWLEMGAEK